MSENRDRPPKRRRLEETQQSPGEIVNADQLQRLLSFKQDVGPHVRAAVNQFKDFLTSISRNANLAAQSRQLQTLRQYCHAQAASTKDESDFPDLVTTWSFAVQSNNDSVCSAVPAALAQFYKTISNLIEFREFGLSLGRTLLKRDQVRLLDHGLSAAKTKTHLISPCLRLLTELISFDGGTLAPIVFDRDVLFRRIDFFLDRQIIEHSDGGRRKPTVRRMALRLVIAVLKFLDVSAKIEFVMHGHVLRNCVHGLVADGDDIVSEVLKAIENELVEDRNVSRPSKHRVFRGDTLQALAALYDYELDQDYPDSATRVRNAAHGLLLKICTTKKGILQSQSGWYPSTFGLKIDDRSDESFIDLGLYSPSNNDQYEINVPVKNDVLSRFISNLKPESDMLQSTLLLRILRAAPELVADYLSRKSSLADPSSDDSVWRNQFAFYLSLVQLPVPSNFGWLDGPPTSPPPVSIVIQSIIPQPFDRAILSKYFTSNEEVLVLSAARLLLVALEKLHALAVMFASRRGSEKWSQALTRLVEIVLKRTPKVQEMVNALQRTGNDNDIVKTALYKCIATFHRVLPEAVSGSRFDISSALMDILFRLESTGIESQEQTSEVRENLMEQLTPVLGIAELSNATKWWIKPDATTMSLFGRLLRFSTTKMMNEETGPVVSAILKSVAMSAGFLSQGVHSFTALQLSVASTSTFQPVNEVWIMLDNALSHAVAKPVKYLDQIEAIQRTVSDWKSISVLAATVAEQWEYVLKRHATQENVITNAAEWTIRLYSALDSIGENSRVMRQLQDGMLQIAEGACRHILRKAIDETSMHPVLVDCRALTAVVPSEKTQPPAIAREVNLSETLGTPAGNPTSLGRSERWDDTTDIEMAVQSGRVAHLLRCTASSDEETRRQTFVNLQSLLHSVDGSAYDEKTQLHLLIGETVGTIRQHGLNMPFPSMAAELAARLLQIVANPGDKMYGKANTFLLRSPVWQLRRLISEWIRDVALREPESDDAGSWMAEIEWLIEWLIAGLQTSADMEIYRHSGAIEKVLVIYTKPGMARAVRRLILTLVWRSICVGGADTLITRVGIDSWLRIAAVVDRDHANIIHELAHAVARQCSTESIRRWQHDRPVLREVK